jgi:5'-3' exonuclease
MMITYRELFPRLGGYLTHKNKIHLPRVELFVQELARREPLYFAQRGIEEEVEEFKNPKEYAEYYYKV